MSCYGLGITGSRWADDYDDEWDLETFKASSANIRYYGNEAPDASNNANEPTAAEPDLSFSDDSDDSDNSEDGQKHAPRPATPEPDDLDNWSFGSLEDPPFDEAERRQVEWARRLVVPYPNEVPLGFHPDTPGWLEHGRKGKIALPILVEEGGYYTRAWNHMKVHCKLKEYEPLFPSPLWRVTHVDDEEEVVPTEEEVAPAKDEVVPTAEKIMSTEEAPESELELSPDQEPAPSHPDEPPAATEAEQSEADVAETTSNITASMESPFPSNEPLPIVSISKENLVFDTTETEESISSMEAQDIMTVQSSEKQNGMTGFEKRDSVLENDETVVIGLFREDEIPDSPDSVVLVSTDEELDMIQEAPLLVETEKPIDQVKNGAESEPYMLPSTASMTTPDDQHVASSQVSHTDETLKGVKTEEERDWIMQINQGPIEAPQSTRKSYHLFKMDYGKWNTPMETLSSIFLPRSTLVRSDDSEQDASSLLKARYFNIRLCAKKSEYWASSTILQTLGASIVH